MSPRCSELLSRCMSSSTPSSMTRGCAFALIELIPRINIAAPCSKLPECIFMRISPPSFSVISSSIERPLPFDTKLFCAVMVVPSLYIGAKASLSMLMRTSWLASPAIILTCCDRYLGACTKSVVANVGTLMVNLPSASVMAAYRLSSSVFNRTPAIGALVASSTTTPCT